MPVKIRFAALLVLGLGVVGCSPVQPFKERQQWQVTGRDGETRVDTVVGTGWLLSVPAEPNDNQPAPLPGTPTRPQKMVYSNKNAAWGVMTALFRADASPTLLLDPEKREGLVMWNAGQAGNIYICRFTFAAGQKRLGGTLLKHVQVEDVPVGTCILELK